MLTAGLLLWANRVGINKPRMNKILIIDHDEASRAALAVTLQQQGFEVLQADTGVQGVQLARAESPNLILCDVDLQGVGGSLILFAVRRDPHLASIPFVLMSRFAVSEASPQGIDKGADGFLSKPVTPRALASTIDECLNKRSELPPSESEPNGAPAAARACSWEGLLESLHPLVEATRIISTEYHQRDSKEIIGLAAQAHQTAVNLYRKIEGRIPALAGGC